MPGTLKKTKTTKKLLFVRPKAYNMLVDMYLWFCANRVKLTNLLRPGASGDVRLPFVEVYNEHNQLFERGCIVAVDRPTCDQDQSESHFWGSQSYFVRVPTANDCGKLILLFKPLNAGHPTRPNWSCGIMLGDGVAYVRWPQALLDDQDFVWNCQATPDVGSDPQADPCKLVIDNNGPVTVLWPSLQQVRDGHVALDANHCALAKVRMQGDCRTGVTGAGSDCDATAVKHDVPADACSLGRSYVLQVTRNPITGDAECGSFEVFKCGDPLLDLVEERQVTLPPPLGPVLAEPIVVEITGFSNASDVFLPEDVLTRCIRATATPWNIDYEIYYASDKPGTLQTHTEAG